MIYINEHICIPGGGTTLQKSGGAPVLGPLPALGQANLFPYGQCTWYANQRFYQLHHAYVPWVMGANAWQWTARAYQYHWRVSGSPSVGAIVDLQPWVQGAYNLGHVAVVEQVLGNGDVIASNMNWGAYYWAVTRVHFSPGYGVSFITL
jgi:surface antigen